MLPALLLPLLLVAACDKVPLLAPTGTTITLFPETTTISLNSEVNIVATVIEHGASSGGSGSGNTSVTSTGGTPVQNGTVVTFTTTIGRIEPSEARTHNGTVTVKLITGGVSGTATITAYSGGASAQFTNLKIGTAAAKTVNLTASPQTLGSSGGSTTLQASVTDEGGNPLSGVPVTFATDHGTITPSTANTDANGVATATLTTTVASKVSATAGTVKSADVAVNVNAFALSGFTATPQSTAAGAPVVFTIKPTTGANITNVRLDFGDGNGRNLGQLTTDQTIPYAYNSPGIYTATATVTDASGGTGALSTTVIVGSQQITLTAKPDPSTVNSPTTFTVTGLATGTQVDHFIWTFDDGTPPVRSTSPSNTHTFVTRGIKNVRVDVFGINGGVIGSASTTVDVQ